MEIKKIITVSILLLAMTNTIIRACPTCIGRLDGNTPPIFTKEYDAQYWPENQNKKDDTHNTQSKTQQKQAQS